MSRPEYDVREDYIGTGSLSSYSFDFKIESLDQLLVIEMNTAGEEVQRVRGTDLAYISSVDFDPTGGGGTVHLTDALTENHKLILLLANDEPTQSFEFKGKTSFTLPRFEAALDRLAGAIQRLAYLGKRSVKLHDSIDPNVFDPTLPAEIAEAQARVLTTKADGTGLEMGITVATIMAAEAYAQAAGVDADAAAAAAQAATDAQTAADAAELAATAAAVSATASATSAEEAAEAAQLAADSIGTGVEDAQAAQLAAEAAAAAALASSGDALFSANAASDFSNSAANSAINASDSASTAIDYAYEAYNARVEAETARDAAIAASENIGVESYTQAEIDALTTMVEGDVVYNSTTKTLNIYDGTEWVEVSGSEGGEVNATELQGWGIVDESPTQGHVLTWDSPAGGWAPRAPTGGGGGGTGGSTGVVGEIIAYAGTSVPAGFLECKGQAVSRTDYSQLFSAIGTTWGTGDGSTTFALPDTYTAGRFLRGETATNPVGTYQDDDLKSHAHNINTYGNTATDASGGNRIVAGDSSAVPATNLIVNNTLNFGGTETRPTNAAVKFLIRYSGTVDSESTTISASAGVIGEYLISAHTTAPENHFECNGQAVSRTQYADLFSAIGTTYGTGDGSTTFNVPDLETDGLFLRSATATNPVGTVQSDAFQGHYHSVNDPGHSHEIERTNEASGTVSFYYANGTALQNANTFSATTGLTVRAPSSDGTNGTPRTANETRPKNIASKVYIRHSRDTIEIENIGAGLVVQDPSLVGGVTILAYDEVPTNHLACNGATVSRTEYAELFAKIGTTWGAGDGSTTFKLPDLETDGRFIRSKTASVGVGTYQADATARPNSAFTGATTTTGTHTHSIKHSAGTSRDGVGDGLNSSDLTPISNQSGYVVSGGGTHNHNISITGGGDAETRPVNASFKVVIRYKKDFEGVLSLAEVSEEVARARYSTNAGQSIPNGLATIVDFGDESFNKGLNITTGSAWKLTASEPGEYRVNSAITLGATSTLIDSESLELGIYKNGVFYSQIGRFENFTGAFMYGTANGGDTIQLAAGDYIDVRVYQNSGAALPLFTNSAFNYINIEYIPDQSKMLAAYYDGLNTRMPEVARTYTQRSSIDYSTDTHLPIVSNGSNSDGEWTRFADGTQICSKRFTSFTATFTAAGGIARSDVFTWTLPAAFKDALFGVSGGNDSFANGTWMTSRPSTNTAAVYRFANISAGGSIAMGDHSLMAIGRWK